MPPRAAKTRDSTLDRLDPWKYDGNIVLAAQGKCFRVHRSILSTYSEVFKDMFSCSHSDGAEEFIEECPVIHLYDAATDVEIMLKALYDRSYPVPWQHKGILPFHFVVVFFRLGEKYAIPMLIDEAKARLSRSIDPTTFSLTSPPLTASGLKQFPGITDSDPHGFQIMNLLEEMDLKAPLPLAMYQCVITCPQTAIVDGYEHNGLACFLSSANLRAFIHIKNLLQTLRIQLVKKLLSKTTRNCSKRCDFNLRQSLTDSMADVMSFDPWKSMCRWDALICTNCKGHLEGEREIIMNTTWNELPKVFGIDSWQDAKERMIIVTSD